MSALKSLQTNFEFFALRALKNYGERALLLEELDKSNCPVFVYQVGKVGSSSIKNSLRSQYHQPVLHGHGFASDFHNWQIRLLYRVFMEGKPLDIITLTREPVSRNVSHFFQKFKDYSGRQPEEFTQASIADILNLFLKTYDHDLTTHWFDNHIKKKFGIDVYEKEMPDCGYQFYERGRVRILLIKLETSNFTKEEAVKKFLNIDTFNIINTNIGTNKSYGKLYRFFTENASLPKDYIETALTTRYFTHFYDEQTATAVWKKWYKKK